jgi:hypothetical protein
MMIIIITIIIISSSSAAAAIIVSASFIYFLFERKLKFVAYKINILHYLQCF